MRGKGRGPGEEGGGGELEGVRGGEVVGEYSNKKLNRKDRTGGRQDDATHTQSDDRPLTHKYKNKRTPTTPTETHTQTQLQRRVLWEMLSYFLADRVLLNQSRPSYRPSPVVAQVAWMNQVLPLIV